MGAFFVFIGCIVFLIVQWLIRSTTTKQKNDLYYKKVKEEQYNEGRQFELEYIIRAIYSDYQEQTGISKEIVANILSARYDNVEYNPKLNCYSGMLPTAENAILAYQLGLEGFRMNPKSLRKQGCDMDLTIPDDYIIQSKLYTLSTKELEDLTGLDYGRLAAKFAQLNEGFWKYQMEASTKRVKGIMVRYQMEQEGLQFYGMHDFAFVNQTVYPTEVNDEFSLEDCKNWGTPLHFQVEKEERIYECHI